MCFVGEPTFFWLLLRCGQVRRLTHNLPEEWRGPQARTQAVLDDVKRLFQPRVTGVLQVMGQF